MNIRLVPLIGFAVFAFISTSTALVAASDRPVKTDHIKTTEWVATMLMEGKYQELNDAFSATLQVMLPAAKIKEVMDQMTAQIGSLTQVGKAHTRKLQGVPIGELTCKAENGRLVVQVRFDDDEIEGLWVVPGQ